jgi:hypothetical protein
VAIVGAATRAEAIPVGVDDFQDGTTMGWFVPVPEPPTPPSPFPPINSGTGGPGGAGDAFLLLQADASLGGAGSRLSVLNGSQWTGDFRAAGIVAIAMDVIVGQDEGLAEELTLRLLFEDFDGPGPPANLALTVAGVVVAAGQDWATVVFDLSPANLLQAGFGTVEGALTDVDVLRIFHNPDPAFPGPGVGPPAVTTVMGIDNIRAIVEVPEPATVALLIGGIGAALFRSRRR